MANKQHEAAQEVYDAVTRFEAYLHYNDGDRYDSKISANWLSMARSKLNAQIDHLMSVPSQPDR